MFTLSFSQHFVGNKFHCFLFSQLFSPFVFVGLSNSSKGKWSILKTGKCDLTPQKWAWGSRSGNSIPDSFFPRSCKQQLAFKPGHGSSLCAEQRNLALAFARFGVGSSGQAGSSVPQQRRHQSSPELLPNLYWGSEAQDLAHHLLPESKVAPLWPYLPTGTSRGQEQMNQCLR